MIHSALVIVEVPFANAEQLYLDSLHTPESRLLPGELTMPFVCTGLLRCVCLYSSTTTRKKSTSQGNRYRVPVYLHGHNQREMKVNQMKVVLGGDIGKR